MNKLIQSLLFLVALTPLFVDNLVFYPHTSPKSIFFRTIIVLVSILFIIGFIFINKYIHGVIYKIKTFSKDPLIISILIFILFVGISTIFALDKYTAFWGTLERGEGLVVMIYSFSFLIFSLFFFVKKDWITFFKLNLFVSLIVLVKEFLQFFGGAVRPESFFGNPTFLAGYLIFSIMFSIILFAEEKKRFWKYISIITFILSIIGIFIAETRGTILGLVVGAFIFLVYAIIKGNNVNYKKFNLRTISLIILSIIIAFSVIFIVTRKSEIWQKVPGLSRVAVISLDDSSTSTRLITQKISLQASNPKENGLKNFLIGYGQDNFSYAYGKYFNPAQFEDEMKWFDRSHNKFLDVLVMNGIFCLIAYLSIFVICFIYIWKKKDFSLWRAGLLFGITTYLVHLFFVFDQPTTYIMLFATLSFVIYMNSENSKIKEFIIKNNSKNYILGVILLFIFTISSVFVYLKNDLTAYIQMRKFTSLLQTHNLSFIFRDVDSVLSPFTVAQSNIRRVLFSITNNNFDKENKEILKFSDKAILKGEEYLEKNPSDLLFLVYLAKDYTDKGRKSKDIRLLEGGELCFKKALEIVPNRPDFNYGVAINLFHQKRYSESFIYLDEAFSSSPEYYIKNKETAEDFYVFYFKYFLQEKDLKNMIKSANRLQENNYSNSDDLAKIIDYIEKNNTWPRINFE